MLAKVVKLVLSKGLTLDEPAKWISTSSGTFANRASAAKKGSDPTAPLGNRRLSELKAGAKLRKELAVEGRQQKVLKKANETDSGRCLAGIMVAT